MVLVKYQSFELQKSGTGLNEIWYRDGLKSVKPPLKVCKPKCEVLQMITLEFKKQVNLETKKTTSDVYLRLYLSAFKSGLVADLKPTNFTVLLTICSFMDENGECYPTQRQIAERSGISKTTVNKAINELLEYRLNGKPIILREMVVMGTQKNSVYTVNPISQVAIFNGDVEEISNTAGENEETLAHQEIFDNAKQVADYFIYVYRDEYGSNPHINFARELSIVKKKIIGKYTHKQIKTMIDVGVREYKTRWKNDKFPRPTLAAIATFIGVQALGIEEDTEKEFEENVEATADGLEMNELALSRLANRLK